MKILIYEDNNFKDLYPLSMLRGVYDISFGASTIKGRIEKIIAGKFEVNLHCRKNLKNYLSEVHKNKINLITKDDYLFLNGRVIFTDVSLKNLISKKEKNTYYTFNNQIISAFISKEKIESLENKIQRSEDSVIIPEFFAEIGLKEINLKEDFKIFIIKYPWDPIQYILNGGLINDLDDFLSDNKKLAKIKDNNYSINPKKIFISKNSKIYPNVSIDATPGAVVISDNATVEPFTFIKGPAFIGKNVFVKSGTKIYGPCVIGEYSKVGGEIAESILHSFVNKQHEGFVGHSYICPFVNLGADTVTSDLKNNYSEVRMKLNNKDVDTGMQFLGSIIGDHSKTSINTMLNTGNLIGPFANIFGGGFPPKEINSFSWNEAGKASISYDVDKAIETARIVMDRRGVKMSKSYEDLVRLYYQML